MLHRISFRGSNKLVPVFVHVIHHAIYCHFTLSLLFSLQTTEQATRSKEEKAKIALEKIKEANIKKVILYAVNAVQHRKIIARVRAGLDGDCDANKTKVQNCTFSLLVSHSSSKPTIN